MNGVTTLNRKKIISFVIVASTLYIMLFIRLFIFMIVDSSKYAEIIKELHEREREIKAPRGEICDRNGVVIATNKTVCTVSVIYNQMENKEEIIKVLTEELDMSEEVVRKKVEKVSVREKIKSNVDKETGDRIRNYNLAGVKVDEDYKRYYLYSSLASKVIGFTGGDNQGIVGLEVEYEEYLKGTPGKILTKTDAKGVELDGVVETRVEGIKGKNLYTSLDVNIQKYAEQAAAKVMEEKQANYVSIIVMNPNNGEIYAMVNTPEYDLNNPFVLPDTMDIASMTEQQKNDALNQMWRNQSVNDTYEPGSTFKIITSTIALEEGKVSVNDTFSCPGFAIVEDRKIRCHKVKGHGAETFVQGIQNSCKQRVMK